MFTLTCSLVLSVSKPLSVLLCTSRSKSAISASIVFVHALDSNSFYIKDAKPAARVTRMSFAFNDTNKNIFEQIWDGIISVCIASTAFPIGLGFRELTTCMLNNWAPVEEDPLNENQAHGNHTATAKTVHDIAYCGTHHAPRFAYTVLFVTVTTLLLVLLRRIVKWIVTSLSNMSCSAKFNGVFLGWTYICRRHQFEHTHDEVIKAEQQWYTTRNTAAKKAGSCCGTDGLEEKYGWEAMDAKRKEQAKKTQIEVMCHCDCTQKETASQTEALTSESIVQPEAKPGELMFRF